MATTAVLDELAQQAEVFLTSSRARVEPNPFFRRLRKEAPVIRAPSGTWLVARYDDCQSVLKDDRLSRREAALRTAAITEGPAFEDYTSRLVCQDGANHLRLRRIVNGSFTPKAVGRWRDRIHGITAGLLEVLRPDQTSDFLAEFAYPLPARVIFELLGVPFEERSQIEGWTNILLEYPLADSTPEFVEEKTGAMVGMGHYLRDLIERRRTTPADDLMTSMIKAEADGSRLSTVELVALLGELIHAGHETTANLIGNGLYCLFKHPEQMQRLVDDPSLAATAVEEMMRFISPIVMSLPRVATHDVELRGATIPRGEMVIALLGSANRDPEVFDRPDEFDVGRSENPHIGFGFKTHFCLGANLARAEAAEAFKTLAESVLGELQLAEEPEWMEHHIVRRLTGLPVRR